MWTESVRVMEISIPQTYFESALNLSWEAESVCTFIKTKRAGTVAAAMRVFSEGKGGKKPSTHTKVC